MKRLLLALTFFLYFGCALSFAQVQVRFVLTGVPAQTPATDSIYLAASFNNWNPGAEPYRFRWSNASVPGSMVGEKRVRSLTLPLRPGRYEYKLTRGSWSKGETGATGAPADNRELVVLGDTTIEIQVAGWADGFPQLATANTANTHVRVIDTAFFIPQLDRYRRVWIYLPADYAVSKKKYPVLYMHDGQNVFDSKTSGFGEWGVDEALDTLEKKLGGLIVVAVDHGGDKRLNEYAPYNMQRFGKGEGDVYVDFLRKTLKRYIDRNYRTKKDREHTFIAGSSMGGLISFYAHYKYPKVYGASGVFSPAFWINPQFRSLDPKRLKKLKGKVYLYAGTSESAEMVPDMLLVHDQLRRYSKAAIVSVVRSEARHNEAAWRKELPGFFEWLLR